MTNAATQKQEDTVKSFSEEFKSKFYGVLRWPQLDEIWDILSKDSDDSWYIYKLIDKPPIQAVSKKDLKAFIKGIDKYLQQYHDEEYCGIVYVDDFKTPAFIKIFDPGNLGTSCSIAKSGPLPEWILSKIAPQEIISQPERSKYKKSNWLGKLFSN